MKDRFSIPIKITQKDWLDLHLLTKNYINGSNNNGCCYSKVVRKV